MGVSGVAIATVISNMVSSGIIVYIMTHESEPIRLEFRKLAVAPAELKDIGHWCPGRNSGHDVFNCQCVYKVQLIASARMRLRVLRQH